MQNLRILEDMDKTEKRTKKACLKMGSKLCILSVRDFLLRFELSLRFPAVTGFFFGAMAGLFQTFWLK